MNRTTASRRAVAFGSAALVALALAGCSTETTAGGGNSEDSQVLTFTAAGEAPAQAVIDAFEAANPGVTVEATFANDDASYQQTLRTQLSAGTAPDVFRIWPGGGNSTAVRTLGDDDLLMSLEDESWAADLNDTQRSVSESSDGTLVGIPVTVVGIGAVWNDQALEASGLEGPTTWTEVLDFCAAAKEQGKVAFALGLKSAWTTQLVPYALTASLVYGPEPDFTQQQLDGEATFADSGWKDAMDQYVAMQDAGCFTENPNGVGYDEQMKSLGEGTALGAIQVTSSAANADQYAAEGTTFSMTPLPATDDPADTYLPVSVGIEYAINAKAKNPDLARKFLEFLASSEGQAIYATESGAAPALPSADFESTPVLVPVAEFQAEGLDRPFPDVFWPSPKVQAEHLAAIQELFNKTIDSAQVLERMDTAFGED